MLASLRIENFAIVSKLELEFHEGMTVFTGETGAGKSIMIDALMLALGGRADATVVRHGALMCEVVACFHIGINSLPAQWLQTQDVFSDEGEVVLRRVVYAEGRSKSYINGTLFPLQKMKELSEMLVDIHGQHQHQTLLHHPTHRTQLDQFINHQALLDEVAAMYRRCAKLQHDLDSMTNEQSAQERMALIQYQLEELTLLDLQENEVHNLHQEHLLLNHARDYLKHSSEALGLLSENEDINIRHAMHEVLQRLALLPEANPCVKNALELLNNAFIHCDEAHGEMMRFSRQIQLDPERLQAVEERMSLLHQVARKFHIDAGQLLEKREQLQAELTLLQQKHHEKQHLEASFLKAQKDYEAAAQRLRDSRTSHAPRLAEKITQVIQQLGMPKGFIEIRMTALDKMQAHGLDKVEYFVCTNPGMLPDTLAKVASGGELSRISLAIQMITAQAAYTPTLLFDEVDVGIGGATAQLVGQMLRGLSERLQVFCVTHQPQVASCAHNHFKVEKKMDDTTTHSVVMPLTREEKVEEIARMMGGVTITEQTKAHARELLDQ